MISPVNGIVKRFDGTQSVGSVTVNAGMEGEADAEA